MLVHGVALVVERGAVGATLVAAVAIGCAGSDVSAFIVGRRFGRSLLAPRLSPNKTEPVWSAIAIGAGFACLVASPVLVPVIGWLGVATLTGVVAVGAVWGDLLGSAAKQIRRGGCRHLAAGFRWHPRPGGFAPARPAARLLACTHRGPRRDHEGLAVLAGSEDRPRNHSSRGWTRPRASRPRPADRGRRGAGAPAPPGADLSEPRQPPRYSRASPRARPPGRHPSGDRRRRRLLVPEAPVPVRGLMVRRGSVPARRHRRESVRTVEALLEEDGVSSSSRRAPAVGPGR